MAGPNDLARAGGRSEDGTSGDAGERACMPSAVVSRRRTIGEISDPVVAAALTQSATSMTAGRPRRAPTDSPVRVFVVEQHSLLRLGLVSLYGTARYCHVVGEASSAEDLPRQIREALADVVVMDADLPAGAAIVACAQIRTETPNVGVVLLASMVEPRQVVAAIRAQAGGYVLKNAEPDQLVDAVQIVAAGGVYLQTEMANAVQEWFRAGQPGSDPLGRLSQQERRILALIAEGKTNRDIAAGLGLSEYTVKTYVSSALSKLGLSSRAQAAAFVVRHTGP